MEIKKRCSGCGEIKKLRMFHENVHKKDSLCQVKEDQEVNDFLSKVICEGCFKKGLKKYRQSENYKECQRKYNQSEKGKKTRREWKRDHSENYKEYQREYRQSESYRESQRKYNQSEKGKKIRQKYWKATNCLVNK